MKSAFVGLISNQTIWNRKIFTFFLIFLGVVLPFLIVTSIPYYFKYDVDIFLDWADCFAKAQDRIYLECHPNYPSLGLALSAGAIYIIKSVFGIVDKSTIISVFRLYLACFDSLNFLLFIWLASLMNFRFPIFFGLILLILPSTIAGGAIWGQIDGAALSFMVLSVICLYKSWGIHEVAAKQLWVRAIWLLLGLINFTFYVLCKQISIFSIPFFATILLISLWNLWKDFRYKGIYLFLFSLILFASFFHYVDGLFEVPHQFRESSYWFAWRGGGSDHASELSASGFNIWMFLGRDEESSTLLPFADLTLGNWHIDLTPYHTGLFLYAVLMMFLCLIGIKPLWQFIRSEPEIVRNSRSDGFLMAMLCFFLGISHLGFNVLLTGTHERYLYFGYPFLLIAATWFCIHQLTFSRTSTFLCFFAASAYGAFVFSLLKPLPGLLFPLQRQEFLASIHLFLLCFLLPLWVRVCQINKNILLAD
jgi:hypothetical protein